ncbi:hypothetical protein BC829DRAFT_258258 [Chytridium lagenaria]|nr:hypothetical protein BC829DRAFT_258258 [Chytridium lagenaria]
MELGRFPENLRNLRKSCAELLQEEFGETQGSLSRIEWIPIEWHSIVHALETVDQRMRIISLPTTPVFRQINNDILADVLFFFSCFHGPRFFRLWQKFLTPPMLPSWKRIPNSMESSAFSVILLVASSPTTFLPTSTALKIPKNLSGPCRRTRRITRSLTQSLISARNSCSPLEALSARCSSCEDNVLRLTKSRTT